MYRLRATSRGQFCLQFRLRTLLLFVTGFGLWLGAYLHQIRERKALLQAIRAHDGWVYYDYQEEPPGSGSFSSGPYKPEPPLPRWFVSQLGEEALFDVGWINLAFCNFPEDRATDSGEAMELLRRLVVLPEVRVLGLHEAQRDDSALTAVSKLTNLESLGICDGSEMTDRAIAGLTRLKRLRHLRIANANVTDEWLRALGHLSALEDLELDCRDLAPGEVATPPQPAHFGSESPNGGDDGPSTGGRISSEALACLKSLKRLRYLDLSGNAVVNDEWGRYVGQLISLESLTLKNTNVTSKTLEHLSRLTNLRTLDLSSCHISDSGVRHLAELRQLEGLELKDTAVTSDCLCDLKGLTRLRRLDLSGNRGITDKGACALADMVQLEELSIENTRVTPAGLEHLKRLKKLRYLVVSVPDFNVYLSVRTSLAEALPGCSVSVFVEALFREGGPLWTNRARRY